jgi:hypothetical protein
VPTTNRRVHARISQCSSWTGSGSRKRGRRDRPRSDDLRTQQGPATATSPPRRGASLMRFPDVFGARRALRPSYTPYCALLRRRRVGSSCSRALGWRPCSSKILALTYWCGSASTIVAPSSGRTYDLLILCLAPSCGSRGRRRNGERVTAQNYERWKAANPRRGASPMRGATVSVPRRTWCALRPFCTPTHCAFGVVN